MRIYEKPLIITKLEISTREKIVIENNEENQLLKDCIEIARKFVDKTEKVKR